MVCIQILTFPPLGRPSLTSGISTSGQYLHHGSVACRAGPIGGTPRRRITANTQIHPDTLAPRPEPLFSSRVSTDIGDTSSRAGDPSKHGHGMKTRELPSPHHKRPIWPYTRPVVDQGGVPGYRDGMIYFHTPASGTIKVPGS